MPRVLVIEKGATNTRLKGSKDDCMKYRAYLLMEGFRFQDVVIVDG